MYSQLPRQLQDVSQLFIRSTALSWNALGYFPIRLPGGSPSRRPESSLQRSWRRDRMGEAHLNGFQSVAPKFVDLVGRFLGSLDTGRVQPESAAGPSAMRFADASHWIDRFAMALRDSQRAQSNAPWRSHDRVTVPAQFGIIQSTINTTPIGSGTPRQIQFMMRLFFRPGGEGLPAREHAVRFD